MQRMDHTFIFTAEARLECGLGLHRDRSAVWYTGPLFGTVFQVRGAAVGNRASSLRSERRFVAASLTINKIMEN